MTDRKLAHFIEGVPERFVPGEADGALMEAEHVGRYAWAAQLAQGATILDAGCGLGYGAAILADAGARSVTAVDIADEAVQAARERVPPTVEVAQGDVTRLSYADASFDLIVCFEVIEHLDDPAAAVAEFARVLAGEGVLVVSSPNAKTYPAGNPHHRHEFMPDELRALLERHFTHVRLSRQHAWLASTVLDDSAFANTSDDPLDAPDVYKSASVPLDEEHYTIAVAGNAPLPRLRPTVRLASSFELAWWAEQVADLEARLADAARYEHIAEALEQTRAELARRVRELEAAGRAAATELEVREEALATLSEQLVGSEDALRSAGAEHRRLQAAVDEVLATRTFRYAAPFRAAWGQIRRARTRRNA